MVQIYRPPTADPTDERFAFRNGDSGPFEFNDRGACWFEDEIPEDWVEMVPGTPPWTPIDRPVGNPGTHVTHCCSEHGCKYGHPQCPIKTGELVQDHPCEACEFDDEDEGEAHI